MHGPLLSLAALLLPLAPLRAPADAGPVHVTTETLDQLFRQVPASGGRT